MIYLQGGFKKMSEQEVKQHIIEQYCADVDLVNKFDILAAYWFDEDYEESSFFLLRNKETEELFENNASHCSCYGFEGQFEPKATTTAYLKSENFYCAGLCDEMKSFFAQL